MIDMERRNAIKANITDTLGVKITQQYCQNSAALISMILGADGDKPASIEESLALNMFLTECIKRYYNIDPEMFDIEIQKTYRSMELIIEETAKEKEEMAHHHAEPEMPPMPPHIVEKPFPDVVDGSDSIREFPEPAPEDIPDEIVPEEVDDENTDAVEDTLPTDGEAAESEDTDEDVPVADSDDAEVVGDVVASDTDAEITADDEDDAADDAAATDIDAEVSEDVNEAEPVDTTTETEETVEAEPEVEVADEVPESEDTAEVAEEVENVVEDAVIPPTQDGE